MSQSGHHTPLEDVFERDDVFRYDNMLLLIKQMHIDDQFVDTSMSSKVHDT